MVRKHDLLLTDLIRFKLIHNRDGSLVIRIDRAHLIPAVYSTTESLILDSLLREAVLKASLKWSTDGIIVNAGFLISILNETVVDLKEVEPCLIEVKLRLYYLFIA